MNDFQKRAFDVAYRARQVYEAAHTAYCLHGSNESMAQHRMEAALDEFQKMADILGFDLTERYNPAPDMPVVSLPTPDRAMHRAAVEAGYASLEGYIAQVRGEK